jgi:hypothetical protein
MSAILADTNSARAAFLAAMIGAMCASTITARAGDTCRPVEALSDIESISIFESELDMTPKAIDPKEAPQGICVFGEPRNGRFQVCINQRAVWVLPSQFKFKTGIYLPDPPQSLPDKIHLGAVASLNPPAKTAETDSHGWSRKPGEPQELALGAGSGSSRSIELPGPPPPSGPCACKMDYPDVCR